MIPLPLSFVAVQDAATRYAMVWDQAQGFGGWNVFHYANRYRGLAKARANLEMAIAQYTAERKVTQ